MNGAQAAACSRTFQWTHALSYKLFWCTHRDHFKTSPSRHVLIHNRKKWMALTREHSSLGKEEGSEPWAGGIRRVNRGTSIKWSLERKAKDRKEGKSHQVGQQMSSHLTWLPSHFVLVFPYLFLSLTKRGKSSNWPCWQHRCRLWQNKWQTEQ